MAKRDEAVVIIPEKQYKDMLADVNFLAALQGAGVDSWDGYDVALDMYQNGEED